MPKVDDDYFSPAPTPLKDARSTEHWPDVPPGPTSLASAGMPPFAITRREHVAASRAIQVRSRTAWVVVLSVLAMFVLFAVANNAPGPWAVLATLFGLYVFVLAPRLQWARRGALFRELREHGFSDAGVTTRTAVAASQEAWACFSRMVRFRHGYLLRRRVAWLVLPSRAFRSPDDERAFVELAERHLAHAGQRSS